MEGTIKLKGKSPEKGPLPPTENPCKVFLKEFLDGGPIMRAFVYRESQNLNLEWEDVKAAFFALNGREYVQKGEWFWRIYPE